MPQALEKRTLEAPPEVWQQLEAVLSSIHNILLSKAFAVCVSMGFTISQTIDLSKKRSQKHPEKMETRTLEASPEVWQQLESLRDSNNIVSLSDAFALCVSLGFAATQAIDSYEKQCQSPPEEYENIYRANLSQQEIRELREKAHATGRIYRIIAPGATLAWLIIFPSGGMRRAYCA